MQTPVASHVDTSGIKWYKSRTVIAGLFLVALAVLYIVVVLPIANTPSPQNYRFPFSFETSIYVGVLAILGIHFFYRLAKPADVPIRQNPVGKSEILGMALRTAFMITIGGSYLTGAMTATPNLFVSLTSAPVLGSIVGQNIMTFADYLHTSFAGLLIAFGLAIVVLEILRVILHKQRLGQWLAFGRYLETKTVYWIIAIAVIIQGALGLFLAGTISSIGPYGLLGLNQYGFETLVRHIHGPLGAFVFSMFFAAVYLRIRPEFHIR
ncbi:MAG: hypothetical protein ACREBS_10040 [Nitrososphaerales archaeon]